MEKLNNLKGIFYMEVIKNGVVIEKYEDKNLVVNNGRQIVMQLLGSADSNNKLTKISFGTNGTSPAGTDVAITGSFTKNLGVVSYPSISSVKFEWTLGALEGNGISIAEIGLLSFDSILFARKTREVINKNSDIILNGSWVISF
jgi:hypothetical protein